MIEVQCCERVPAGPYRLRWADAARSRRHIASPQPGAGPVDLERLRYGGVLVVLTDRNGSTAELRALHWNDRFRLKPTAAVSLAPTPSGSELCRPAPIDEFAQKFVDQDHRVSAHSLRRPGANAWGRGQRARETSPTMARGAQQLSGEISDERFQYPEGDSGTYEAFFGRNGQEVLETPTPKSEHSCGLAGRSTPSLLIRRSVVRAHFGEPRIKENQHVACACSRFVRRINIRHPSNTPSGKIESFGLLHEGR